MYRQTDRQTNITILSTPPGSEATITCRNRIDRLVFIGLCTFAHYITVLCGSQYRTKQLG